MWWNMVHASKLMKYSSINRIAGAERASLEEVDRPFPYSAILNFISYFERLTITSETSENTIFVRFYFTICYLMVTSFVTFFFFFADL